MNKVVTALVLTLLAIVWGTQYLVIRTTQGDLPPWLAVALRFALMALLAQGMVITARHRRRLHASAASTEPERIPRSRWLERILLGVTHAISMGLVYIAERRSESSAIAVCVLASTPLFIVMFALARLDGSSSSSSSSRSDDNTDNNNTNTNADRPPPRAIATAILGLVGVGFLFAHRLSSSNGAFQHLGGLTLLLVAAITSAASKTIGKRLATLPPEVLLRDLGFVVALSAALLWSVFERNEPVRWTTRNATALVYLGAIASTAASGAWFVLLRRISIAKLSHLQFATATIGVVSGALLGGERLHVTEWFGVAFIVVAIAAIAHRRARRVVGGKDDRVSSLAHNESV